MQDRDCSLLMAGKPQSGLVVGVTNPFFASSAGNWPNVLTVGREVTFTRRRQRSISKDRQLLARMEDLVATGRTNGRLRQIRLIQMEARTTN